MDHERHGAGDAETGDPVCWAHRLCPECGAMPTAGMPDRCWRCASPIDGSPTDGGVGHNATADDT